MSRNLLLQAIHADSNFLDSYFLLVVNYSNQFEFDKVAKVLAQIDQRNENFTSYEQNMLDCEKAILNGENVKAYDIAMNDLNQHNRDYFTLTDYLIYSLEYVNNPQQVN